MATAIFVAAISVWLTAAGGDTLVATLAFATTLIFTSGSIAWTAIWRRPLTRTFRYLQALFDVLLVTAAVHVTWDGSQSEFAPLYILVIAASALLVPPRGVPLVAALAIVLYVADAMLVHRADPEADLFVQLGIFAFVAVSCGLIAGRLRAASAEHEAMAAELAEFRLREADMRRLEMRAERLEGIAEMSASLAHEIRNPLASIRSASEQLGSLPRSGEDERVLSALVQRESDRLSRLLTDFLDFARTGVTRIAQVDVAAVLRESVELLAARPDLPHDVRIVPELSEAPLIVEGDADLLHRAVFNLLLNAVQSSGAGGQVRVQAGVLGPHQLPGDAGRFSGGAIAVQVIDSGAGIPEEVRDRLFDPFVTTKPGGSGLGLSIVQRAVEAHGGVVTVSAPGEETRFTLVLPLTRWRQHEHDRRNPGPPDGTDNR